MATIVDFIHAWWSKDRVRASPREGQLLRLALGTILVIRCARYEVVGRSLLETSHGATVRYGCEGPSGPVELWVTTSEVPAILLIEEGAEDELAEAELEIWSRE